MNNVQAQAHARIADCLPDGYVPLGFVAAIKCLDESGALTLWTTRTREITDWEAVGMLTTASDTARDAMRASAEDGDQ